MPTQTTVDDHLAKLPEPARAIGDRLRTILDAALPQASGVIWHGHPVWMSGKTPLAGLKAYPRWVTLMIWNGGEITDPSGALQSSRHMSTVKLHTVDDLDDDTVSGWVRAAHGSQARG